MCTLPMDIIFLYILPKLPVKSLLRFKCVSKSFKTEISSTEFIKTQHLHTMSSDDNRLLIVSEIDNTLRIVYNIDNPYASPSICHYPISVGSVNYKAVASCECYLLIRGAFKEGDGLMVHNPATDDEFNDDYKVVRVVEFNSVEGLVREVMVYSLRDNLWKTVARNPTSETFAFRCTTVVVQNHLLHLIFFDVSRVMTRVGCFDMKAERWANDVPLPEILLSEVNPKYTRRLHMHFHLGSLDGKLCFTSPDAQCSTYDLWVMKEYGVNESWVKLISLPIPNGLNELKLLKTVYRPFGYCKGSRQEILCIRGTGEWFRYNLRDKQVVKTEFRSPYKSCCGYHLCKGSLMNFPGS